MQGKKSKQLKTKANYVVNPLAYLKNRKIKIDEQGFLKQLKFIASKFIEVSQKSRYFLIITHSDADGYACGSILQRMMEREGITTNIFYYNRRSSWNLYLKNILSSMHVNEEFSIIFSDLGADYDEIIPVFQNKLINIFILDHHELPVNPKLTLPENVFMVNPNHFGYDGLKEIAGSTLVYMFCKEINRKSIEYAWMALIGISNDTLMNVKDYQSFNQMVVEEAVSEQEIELIDGLFVYGATHETLKNALAHSLLPFIKEVKGSPKVSKQILEDLGINPNKKVIEVTESDIEQLNGKFNRDLSGKYILFPKKKGILRYAFEHGLIISNSHHKYPHQTEKLIASISAPIELKEEYNTFITQITKNLALFIDTPKEYTLNTIIVDADKKIPPNYWSDVASYASVNEIYDPNKILIFGGLDKEIVRLSIRCSEYYPPLKDGRGVDTVIEKLKTEFGGSGGGHKLAGGYKLPLSEYLNMKKNIEKVFPA